MLYSGKGCYSQKNVNDLFEHQPKLLISVPLPNKGIQRAIDQVSETIHGPEGYQRMDDEVIYGKTPLYAWGKKKRRSYVHLCFNAHRKAEAVDRFTALLVDRSNELASGNLVEAHKDDDETCFLVKTTPKRGQARELSQGCSC